MALGAEQAHRSGAGEREPAPGSVTLTGTAPVNGLWPSDHAGVVATIQIPSSSSMALSRSYPADQPRLGLLRHKGITAWQEGPVEPWVETVAAPDRVAGFLRVHPPFARGWSRTWVPHPAAAQ